MLTCISTQKIIKKFHAVQELYAFLLAVDGRTERQNSSSSQNDAWSVLAVDGRTERQNSSSSQNDAWSVLAVDGRTERQNSSSSQNDAWSMLDQLANLHSVALRYLVTLP